MAIIYMSLEITFNYLVVFPCYFCHPPMKDVKRQNGHSQKNPRTQTLALLVQNCKLYISIFYCSLSIAVAREKEGDYPKYTLWNCTLTLFDATLLLVSCITRKY